MEASAQRLQPAQRSGSSPKPQRWPTFHEILQGLHRNGIYLHPHQLAEFLLMHGLPVDLQYVPPHLQAKAKQINDNYQGDQARLEEVREPPSLFLFE